MQNRRKRQINYHIGLFAEFIATVFLKIKFYSIVKRRYRCNFGEIDIIAAKGNKIIFVEVKKRDSFITESISTPSSHRIKRSADYFLAKNLQYSNHEVRIDLIQLNKFLLPKHFKDYINW